jgi:hypothetical protein
LFLVEVYASLIDRQAGLYAVTRRLSAAIDDSAKLFFLPVSVTAWRGGEEARRIVEPFSILQFLQEPPPTVFPLQEEFDN